MQRFLKILAAMENRFGSRDGRHEILEPLFHGAGPDLVFPNLGRFASI
jgi:hypothetical protein